MTFVNFGVLAYLNLYTVAQLRPTFPQAQRTGLHARI